MIEIPVLLLFFSLAYFWHNQMKAMDLVRATGKSFTHKKQWVFLDDSVVQKKLTIKPKAGKLCFFRQFEFEFSDATAKRNKGTIIHHGNRVTAIQFFVDGTIESFKL